MGDQVFVEKQLMKHHIYFIKDFSKGCSWVDKKLQKKNQ